MKLSLSFVLIANLSTNVEGFSVSTRAGAVKPAFASSTLPSKAREVDVKLNAASLSPESVAKKENVETAIWEKFANWITSTENRLYIGWFGTIMFPTLLAATSCFITAFIAAPPGAYSTDSRVLAINRLEQLKSKSLCRLRCS